MNSKITSTISVENARIIFRNFSGEETRYNRKGSKNFCLIIEDHDYAKKLADDGWNVRELSPREEGDESIYYIQVSVSFENIPPKVFLVTKKKKTMLDADSISILDTAEIVNVDLVIRPYNWEIAGKDDVKRGVKAYLKTMYVTIAEDDFADKYSELEGPDEFPF